MTNRHFISWFLNILPNYLLIVFLLTILLMGVRELVSTFRFYEQAEAQQFSVGVSWWLDKITQVLVSLTLALWIMLFLYKVQLRYKLETTGHAVKLRKAAQIHWWVTIIALAMLSARIVSFFYHSSDKLVFNIVMLSFMWLLLVYFLARSRAELKYFREQPLCNIAAAGLLEKHTKFLNAHDFNKAYDLLLKACETAPDGTELWCRLAHFCELFRKNAAETDKYMARAKELISGKKANSASDKACFLNYLGSITYERGEYEKGLEYMKQSIDIEPREGRINMYEEKLSEFEARKNNSKL